MPNSYGADIETVMNSVDSSKAGLSSSVAQERLKKNGKNLIVSKKKKSEFVKFLGQFKDVLIIVLLCCAVISVVLGAVKGDTNEFIDAGMIMLVVLSNSIIGYIQERKSEQAMLALKNMTKPFCKAMRDGKVVKVKTEELVLGDIVILEAGDIVPADLRLVETKSLKVEESALTGESEAVEKDAGKILENNAVLGDRVNMAYMGSVVTYGRGRGVVVSCGMNTEMGKIATELNEIKKESTPLTKRIKTTSIYLTLIVILVSVILFVISVCTGADVFDSFSMAIAIAVCVIPEGLPACMTICMSIGVKRMSAQRAIVKKLPAVETLGSTEVICTDKTGTLTLNKMTVKQAFFFDDALKVFNRCNMSLKTLTGGTVQVAKAEKDAFDLVSNNKTVQAFLASMVLCNDVQIKLENENLSCIGDPTEVALVHCGYAFGVSKDLMEGRFERVGEVPFDSVRKMMTTVNLDKDGKYAYTKGALDSVLSRCTKVLVNGRVKKLTQNDVDTILKQNSALASRALRVLAFAFKKVDKGIRKFTSDNTENDLVFIGLIGMMDPPREEVFESIKTCKEAGIDVVMITGDHKETAFAIANELGICKDKRQVITGEELNKINDEEFVKIVGDYKVYARVSPEHKVKIVRAIKANGKVVAMTGDGVNDAPSIRVADIGVGMGITGTDVTKEAADLILTDDNFATIVGAVKEGRKVYQNIMKILQFLLESSFSSLFAITIVSLIFLGMPQYSIFTAPLLLWINFVSDTFVGLALGFEEAEKDIMKEKPHTKRGSLLKGRVALNIFLPSIFVSGILIALYTVMTLVYHVEPRYATTFCFIFLCFSQLFHAYNLKSDTQSLFSSNPFNNKALNSGFLASAILTIIVVLLPIPALQDAFGICSIDWWAWFVAIGLALLIVPFMEIVKLFDRFMKRRKRMKDEKK